MDTEFYTRYIKYNKYKLYDYVLNFYTTIFNNSSCFNGELNLRTSNNSVKSIQINLNRNAIITLINRFDDIYVNSPIYNTVLHTNIIHHASITTLSICLQLINILNTVDDLLDFTMITTDSCVCDTGCSSRSSSSSIRVLGAQSKLDVNEYDNLLRSLDNCGSKYSVKRLEFVTHCIYNINRFVNTGSNISLNNDCTLFTTTNQSDNTINLLWRVLLYSVDIYTIHPFFDCSVLFEECVCRFVRVVLSAPTTCHRNSCSHNNACNTDMLYNYFYLLDSFNLGCFETFDKVKRKVLIRMLLRLNKSYRFKSTYSYCIELVRCHGFTFDYDHTHKLSFILETCSRIIKITGRRLKTLKQ